MISGYGVSPAPGGRSSTELSGLDSRIVACRSTSMPQGSGSRARPADRPRRSSSCRQRLSAGALSPRPTLLPRIFTLCDRRLRKRSRTASLISARTGTSASAARPSGPGPIRHRTSCLSFSQLPCRCWTSPADRSARRHARLGRQRCRQSARSAPTVSDPAGRSPAGSSCRD